MSTAIEVSQGQVLGDTRGSSSTCSGPPPFSHVPNAPAVAVAAGPLVGLLAVCGLLALMSSLAQRARNLALPA
ncbi:MAG TPA: hypothetical protein VFK41_02730 [Nocardioidaceae bacterium]|nr:hypothetical protein [Nocardioidaceae bacterium]